MTRLVICHGAGSNFKVLEPDGLARPYKVVTMDLLWWEAAADLGLPRYLFKDKLKMMQFCLGHHMICVTTKDGSDETISMAATFETMGATMFDISADKEE